MADLPDDTRPLPADLLAGLIADTRDRTERADVLGALDGIDEAMTANYRLTELDYPDLAYAIDKGGDDLDGPVTLNNDPTGDAMRCTPQEDPMSEDHAQTLRDYARMDWLYAAPAYKVLHALRDGEADSDIWAFTGVTFACGVAPPDGIANIPGVFSRMGCRRCPKCCDATGLPRGKGSPKNDDACRAILGLPTKERA